MAGSGAPAPGGERRAARSRQALARGRRALHLRPGHRQFRRRLRPQRAGERRRARRRGARPGGGDRRGAGRPRCRGRRARRAHPAAHRPQFAHPGDRRQHQRPRGDGRRQFRPAAAPLPADQRGGEAGRPHRHHRRRRRLPSGLAGGPGRLGRGRRGAGRALRPAVAARLCPHRRFRPGRRAAAKRRAATQGEARRESSRFRCGTLRPVMGMVLFQREAGGFPNKLVPFLTTLLFVVISIVPWHVPGLAMVAPAFGLMAVYHWTIYRPDLLPPSAVFVAGLLLDLLNGTPYVGTSALSLLLTRSVLMSQRRFFVNRLFPVLWAGFLLTAAAVVAFEWALVSALHGAVLGARPAIFEALLTVAIFPLASYLLARAQRAFLMRV